MDVDTTKFKSILQEIVRDSNEKREGKLLFILANIFQPVSPQSQVKYKFFPMMKYYGISLEYHQAHKSLLRDLITLNQKHEMVHNKNMLLYGIVSKGHFNLMPTPRA